MKVRVPPSAPGVEPVQGASRKSTPLASQRLPDLAALAGADGAGVRHHAARPGAFDEAVGAEDDLAGHGGIADAEEHAIRLAGDLAWRLAECTTLGRCQLARFIGVVGPQSHLVAGAKEVAGHRVAHQPQTKKAQIRHRLRIVALRPEGWAELTLEPQRQVRKRPIRIHRGDAETRRKTRRRDQNRGHGGSGMAEQAGRFAR